VDSVEQVERALRTRSIKVGPGLSLTLSLSHGRSAPFWCAILFATIAIAGLQPIFAQSPAPSDQHVVILPPREETALTFDATTKAYAAKPGEESCTFHFSVKNTSEKEVVINQVRTSCGCTIAKLPSQPWHIAPGEGGEITLVMDLRGKTGTIIKTATIDMPTSFKELTIVVTVPEISALPNPNRTINQQIAKLDRQAIFKNECADCHAAPTRGQMGPALYTVACAICHDSKHRASSVPDLHALSHPTDADFWRQMTMHGKPESMMPGFAQSEGGPLTGAQIDSLVAYLTSEFVQPPATK
jgi:cytochrome c2